METFIQDGCFDAPQNLNIILMRVTWSVYDKDHMSELRVKNRSERDLRSCEVTWAVEIKPNWWIFSRQNSTTFSIRPWTAIKNKPYVYKELNSPKETSVVLLFFLFLTEAVADTNISEYLILEENTL